MGVCTCVWAKEEGDGRRSCRASLPHPQGNVKKEEGTTRKLCTLVSYYIAFVFHTTEYAFVYVYI